MEGQAGVREVDELWKIERWIALYVFVVYVPDEFHFPLMKLFVFMTSCHPEEWKET